MNLLADPPGGIRPSLAHTRLGQVGKSLAMQPLEREGARPGTAVPLIIGSPRRPRDARRAACAPPLGWGSCRRVVCGFGSLPASLPGSRSGKRVVATIDMTIDTVQDNT